MPGRPPKPTAVLKIQGTARKDRHASRADLELDNELPACPKFFPKAARDEWRWLVHDSKYSKVLARIDRGMLELYCILRAEFRKHVRENTEMQASRMMVMANVAGKLGLNPSDRTKIRMPEEPKAANKFAALREENPLGSSPAVH